MASTTAHIPVEVIEARIREEIGDGGEALEIAEAPATPPASAEQQERTTAPITAAPSDDAPIVSGEDASTGGLPAPVEGQSEAAELTVTTPEVTETEDVVMADAHSTAGIADDINFDTTAELVEVKEE